MSARESFASMDDRGALEPSAYEEARAKLFGFVEAGAEEADLPTFAAAVDTFRAEVRAEGLSESERTFLSFALGLAADVMASRGDEFTVEDEAALTSLRAMATSAPALVESAGDETGEYGIRVAPGGEVLACPGVRRVDVAQKVADYQVRHPDAVLVQRSVRYGAWVEVAS